MFHKKGNGPHPSRLAPCHLMNFGALATVTEQSEEIPLRYKRPILIRCALQHPEGKVFDAAEDSAINFRSSCRGCGLEILMQS